MRHIFTAFSIWKLNHNAWHGNRELWGVPSWHWAVQLVGTGCASSPASLWLTSAWQQCRPLGGTPLLFLCCPSARFPFNTIRIALVADLLEKLPSIKHGSEYIQTGRLSLNITHLVRSGLFELCCQICHACAVLDQQSLQPTHAVINLENNI